MNATSAGTGRRQEMTEDEWDAGWVRCLGLRLSGKTLNDVDRYGQPFRDDTYDMPESAP